MVTLWYLYVPNKVVGEKNAVKKNFVSDGLISLDFECFLMRPVV